MRSDNPLYGTRSLVTGGAGFIGSHIVDLLVEAGSSEIVVIDNMIRGCPENLELARKSGRVRLIVGDIRDKSVMATAIKGVDTVFHQAALRITHCAADPRTAMETMVLATYDLLEMCVQERIRKVVMASSASIYGMSDEFPTPERQNSYNNRTLYGAAKAFGEGLLRSLNDTSGLNYVALRYFNVYGPRMDIHGRYTEVMIRWMERLNNDLPPIIFGDGEQTMDLVHVEDVARANILAATSPATDIALNIGSGTETSLNGLAANLARVMGKPGTVPTHEAERAINPVPRRLCDPRAAEKAIGFKTSVDEEIGLAKLVEWWRRQLIIQPERGAA